MASDDFSKIRRTRMERRLETDVVSRMDQNRHPLLFAERPDLLHPFLQRIELLVFGMHFQPEQSKILHMMQFANHVFIVRMDAAHRQRRPMVLRRDLFVQRMGLPGMRHDGKIHPRRIACLLRLRLQTAIGPVRIDGQIARLLLQMDQHRRGNLVRPDMRVDVKNLSHSNTFANAAGTMAANRPEHRLAAGLRLPFVIL